jgi:hypothetical protein
MSDFIDNSEWGQGGYYVKAKPVHLLVIGIDFGKLHDQTAIVVVRKEQLPIPVVDGDASTLGTDLKQKMGAPKYFIEHAERRPLREHYDVQAARVQALWKTPEYRGARLVGDGSGVGVAVRDHFRKYNLPMRWITMTGGRKPHSDGEFGDTVPKVDLFGKLFGLFSAGALSISPSLPDYQELMLQLRNLHTQITQGGAGVTFNAQGNFHDDYASACALAGYVIDPPGGNSWSVVPSGGRGNPI